MSRGQAMWDGCWHVGNAEALSIMSTALAQAMASRQTVIGGVRSSAWWGRRSLYNEISVQ